MGAAENKSDHNAPKEDNTCSNTSTDELDKTLRKICESGRGIDTTVLKRIINIAIEISREGREGRKIGTMFVVGDEQAVMAHSRPLILDPLKGHPESDRKILNAGLNETIKELAMLDGAFVVSGTGIFLSAARYIHSEVKDIQIPLGLGSRHIAAASITHVTRAIAVVVSESSVVRIMLDGKVVYEITPELWLIQKFVVKSAGKDQPDLIEENVTPFLK